ncbi:MAG TPA: hypothetical protein VFB65_21030 [Pyrinomonadaceae bacterium]|nr:hypothetical protein [Pyrinomonadaceae bacterium]
MVTLDNAGPIQMGFWVPNRVWATAKFLVPLRDYIAAKKQAGTLTPMTRVYRVWVNSMIDQANARPEERVPRIKNFLEVLATFSGLKTTTAFADSELEQVATAAMKCNGVALS